jgi:cytochrome P450
VKEMDFSAGFCQQYPARVLCDLIGVSQTDWENIQGWTETSFLTHQDRGNDPVQFAEANEKLNEYGAMLIRRAKQGEAEDSIISRLVTSQIAEANFSDEEIFGLVRLLLQAGHSTTAMSFANVVHAIAAQEEYQLLLRDDESLILPFIQEVLRLDTPVMGNVRRVREDTVFQGRELKKDEHLILSWASANHDPQAFENADELSLNRDPRLSLTFGHGVHKCPGMPLALMEIRIAIEELFLKTSWFRIAGPVVRKAWEANGVKHLPLTLEWR